MKQKTLNTRFLQDVRIASILVLALITIMPTYARAEAPTAPYAEIYKNPQCGCCENWADYLRKNGYSVKVSSTEELVHMSENAGVAPDMQGCHLAFISDYVVSGHVPVEAINHMLSEKPNIQGISVPGMPVGSPGMPGSLEKELTVYKIQSNNNSEIYHFQ